MNELDISKLLYNNLNNILSSKFYFLIWNRKAKDFRPCESVFVFLSKIYLIVFQPLSEETGIYLSTSTFIAKIHVYPTDFLLNLKRTVKLRSCLKFIPRQIETYVEADWSPRYAVNSGLMTKIKGFKMRDRGSIWPEHTCLKW